MGARDREIVNEMERVVTPGSDPFVRNVISLATRELPFLNREIRLLGNISVKYFHPVSLVSH